MFTFFKRSSSKHKCDDSRSASGTPPPCSSRLPSSSASALLTVAAGGGGGGERKAPKNKRVRFKFVSDHEEDESRQNPRVEVPVSATRSSQLHGKCVDAASSSSHQRDHPPHPFYSVEEPLSPTTIEQKHVFSEFDNDVVGQEHSERVAAAAVKPRSALNQLLDRMGGKKNRYRGNVGGGNTKKAKHQNDQQQQKRFTDNNNVILANKPQNVDPHQGVKKCDQDDYDDNEHQFYYDRDGCVRADSTVFAADRQETAKIGYYDSDGYGGCRADDAPHNVLVSGCGVEEECVEDDNDDDEEDAGIGEITEVVAGKANAAFNARGGDQHENRPEILHKINLENSLSGLSQRQQQQQQQQREQQQQRHESIEKPQFRLFVNEQPTIAEELSSPPPAADSNNNSNNNTNPAADFVRDLVLNRYKKKRDRPVNRRVDEHEIPTVIFDDPTVPVVVEKHSDTEEEEEDAADRLARIMGQPNSKANSPKPLEKSSSDGSIHPTVIITEEEVFYEAHDVQEATPPPPEDDGVLRIHSPLTIGGGAFKTIHVSTEDLQDELEREESETDSGNYNQNSCYLNTIKNKCGVTVTEIVDTNSGSSSNAEDSGCEETLGSVSPQPRRSPVPVVLVDNRSNSTHNRNVEEDEETEEEEEVDSDEDESENNHIIEARKKKSLKMDTESVTASLPDVVESIGLPNVVHVMHSSISNSAKFNQSDPKSSSGNIMMSSQNGAQGSVSGSGGVLYVDGNSHKSSLVRNIPITILEEASEEDEEEDEEDEEEDPSEVQVVKGNKKTATTMVNGGHNRNHNNHNKNKDYQRRTNGFTPTAENDKQDVFGQSNGLDCDK